MVLFQPSGELERFAAGTPGAPLSDAPTAAENETRRLLSPRQAEIMDLVGAGLTNKDIANRLGLTSGTVKQHLAAIFRKLGVSNRTWAVAMWREASGTSPQERPFALQSKNAREAHLIVARQKHETTVLPVRVTAAVAVALADGIAPGELTANAAHIIETCRQWCEDLEGELHLLPTGTAVALFGYPLSHADDPERALAFADALRGELGRERGIALRLGFDFGPDTILQAGATIVHSQTLAASKQAMKDCPPGSLAMSARTQRLLHQKATEVAALAPLIAPARFIQFPSAQGSPGSSSHQEARWFSVEAWPPQSGKQLMDAWELAIRACNVRTLTLRLSGTHREEARASLLRQMAAQAHDLGHPTYPDAGLGRWLRMLAEEGPVAVFVHGWNESTALTQLLSDDEQADLEKLPLIFVMGPVPVRGAPRLAVRPLLAHGKVPVVSRVHELPLPEMAAPSPGTGADIIALIDPLDETARAVLGLILRYQRSTPQFLAQRLDLTHAALEQQIDRLHRSGLIALWPDRSARIRDERTAYFVREQLGI